jgi:hypothetical protein
MCHEAGAFGKHKEDSHVYVDLNSPSSATHQQTLDKRNIWDFEIERIISKVVINVSFSSWRIAVNG